MRAILTVIAWVLALVLLAGHREAAFFWQAAEGHLQLMAKRRPVAELLRDGSVADDLKRRLQLTQEARSFAVTGLGLPDNPSYRSYVALDRPYVLWNVFAAPEFSVTPKRWCFPVAGCVGYRGFFVRREAEAFADQLRRQGLDVFVGGVQAYSTLQWFDDPLLSTFLRRSDAQLAALIFHELAHQMVYLPGDTAFNESFATSVEITGLERWLASRGEAQAMAEYELSRARRIGFVGLLTQTREALRQFYAQERAPAVLRTGKARILDELRTRYAALRDSWDGYAGYDSWFDLPVNNARLAAVGLYHQWVPAFQALLAEQGGRLDSFYHEVEKLAALNEDERWGRLQSLAAAQD